MSTIKSPRGDTLPLLIDVSALTEDLTGKTFFITVKKSITDSDASTPLKAQHTCTNNDNFYFTFPYDETDGVTTDVDYVYDLQLVTPGTPITVESWPTSKIRFSADVTLRTA